MEKNRTYKFIISGGGTGGHIYPALAIANELKERYKNCEILFVGAKDRMEMEKVPAAGYRIEGLWISGIQRKITVSNLSFPLKVASSLVKARQIVTNFKPDVAIGTGGFASGPVLYAAASKGVPCLIQEQNSFPGITNKILAKQVDSICVAYKGLEKYFPSDKIKLTGNPIRKELLHLENKTVMAKDHFQLKHGKHALLVLGGSLGARNINKLIEDNLDFFESEDIQVIWQCGKLYFQEYRRYNNQENVQVHQFLNNMDMAYAAADIIISRAGASSVSELCVVGKPVIFIPSPNVAEDHQTKNAMAVVDEDAAIIIRENELSEKFQEIFSSLNKNKERRDELGLNIKKLALANATNEIVDEIEKLIQNKKD